LHVLIIIGVMVYNLTILGSCIILCWPGNGLAYGTTPHDGSDHLSEKVIYRQRFRDIKEAPKLDPEAERLRLFESVTEFPRELQSAFPTALSASRPCRRFVSCSSPHSFGHVFDDVLRLVL
jgi:hypothetical protein